MNTQIQKVLTAINGKKTYIVAGVTVLYALLVVGWGQNDWHTALPLLLSGGGLGSLRSALAKVQVGLSEAGNVLNAINSQSSTAPANGGTASAPTTGTANQ